MKVALKRNDDPERVKRIAVLTSGGDAPGMNAAIRAVVRSALAENIEVYGVRRGYHGLLQGEFVELDSHDVSETIQRGGTFLMTARSQTFKTEEGLARSAQMLNIYDVDVLVVIGGDGTFKGAGELAKRGIKIIGIPATIDNDLGCSDYTIGYDTAMNTAIEAIDKLRETASSHERCSVIEVMGREAGYIAFNVGLSTGAECILIPEVEYDLEKDVIKMVLEGRNEGKKHWIIVVAEGAGRATEIAKEIERQTGVESRPTVLGYIQRGGSPSVKDRTTAGLMGLKAVECIINKRFNRIIAETGGKIVDIDIDEAKNMTKSLTKEELDRVNKLF